MKNAHYVRRRGTTRAAPLLLAAGLMIGCDLGGGGGGGPAAKPLPARPEYRPTSPADDPVARGQQLYATQGCALCHAAEGKGGVANPNCETGGKINALTLVKESYTAVALIQKIREGVHHVPRAGKRGPIPPLRMPRYGQWLDDGQLADLAAYLHSLFPKDRKLKDDWDDEEEETDEETDADTDEEPGPAADPAGKPGRAAPPPSAPGAADASSATRDAAPSTAPAAAPTPASPGGR